MNDAPKKRRKNRILRVFGWMVLLVMLIYLSAIAFVQFGYSGNAMFPSDCAIVFGTAVRPSYNEQGEITSYGAGPGIRRRVSTAVELHKEGKVKKLFLTGGKGEGIQKSEAKVMEETALALGVSQRDIVIEEESTSTWENLVNTFRLTGDCRTIVGVSDRTHLARIRLWSLMAGRPIMTYPASVLPGTSFEVRSVLREALGIIVTPIVPYL